MKDTPEQTAFLSAVVDTNDSLLLEAFAGTGKTTTIIRAMERLPVELRSSVLALAFNVKVKEELTKRVPAGVQCKTLNGLGHSALMRAFAGRGVAVEQNKTAAIVSELLRGGSDPEFWRAVVGLVDKAKTHGLVPTGAIGSPKSVRPDTYDTWAELAAFYDIDFSKDIWDFARQALLISVKQAFDGVINFDDQIYIPVVYRLAFPQYSVVFGDEAQDWNELQHLIIRRVLKPNGRLIAVGDRNQSIYGFRGALPNSMDRLRDAHAMKCFPLSVSFRCAKNIIAHAQKDVPEIQARPDAPYGTVRRLDTWSAKDLQSNDAIICRNMAPLLSMAYALIREGIPVKVVGRDIGAGLKALIKKLAGSPARCDLQALGSLVEDWAAREAAAARAKYQFHRIDSIYDKADSLLTVIDMAGAASVDDLPAAIDKIFGSPNGRITLMTGHASKGLEFPRVFFLDPWRIPSKYALQAGLDSWQYQSEVNLRYVIRTRAIEELYYVNENDFASSDPLAERRRSLQTEASEGRFGVEPMENVVGSPEPEYDTINSTTEEM